MLSDDENYTADELAKFLKLKSDRVHELARLGILPHFHLGRQLRFPGSQIRVFIEGGGKALRGGWRRARVPRNTSSAPPASAAERKGDL